MIDKVTVTKVVVELKSIPESRGLDPRLPTKTLSAEAHYDLHMKETLVGTGTISVFGDSEQRTKISDFYAAVQDAVSSVLTGEGKSTAAVMEKGFQLTRVPKDEDNE